MCMAEQVTAKKDAKTQQLKVPPHSFEAEQSVLGGLMLDNEAWDRVAERVIDKDFYSRPHRLIFQAMTRLSNAGNPIDLITLQEELERSEQLEESGGFAYLVEIAKNTPSAANINAYAEIVRERAVVREMISVANEIVEAGYEPQGRTSGDLLDLAESKVFQIAEQRTSANVLRHRASVDPLTGLATVVDADTFTQNREGVATLFNTPELVIDADGLSVFKGRTAELFAVLDRDDILTPHEGEFERLFPGLLAQGREMAIQEAARAAQVTIVLKGAQTLIASPDGRDRRNENGSPWLATAGTGDVLAGMIGGLA